MSQLPTDDTAANSDSSLVETRLGQVISDIGIPPCPKVLTEINAEMRKDEPDFRRLETAISSDVGLSAGLLSLANSPYFGVQCRVRSVREALQVLGLGTASKAVAGLVLRNIFPPVAAMERYWDSSAKIAMLSGWLSGRVQCSWRIRSDEAYTFGLFRDCGIPVLFKRFPHYGLVLQEANASEDKGFTVIEDAHCKINHAAIGGLLAAAWWLPDDVALAIRHHHNYPLLDTSTLSQTSRGLIAVAQFAEHLLQTHTGRSQTSEWKKIGPVCLETLDVSDEALQEIYTDSAALITAS